MVDVGTKPGGGPASGRGECGMNDEVGMKPGGGSASGTGVCGSGTSSRTLEVGTNPGGVFASEPTEAVGIRCPDADMATNPGGGPSSGRAASALAEAINPGGIGDPGMKPDGTSSGMGVTGKGGGSDTERSSACPREDPLGLNAADLLDCKDSERD